LVDSTKEAAIKKAKQALNDLLGDLINMSYGTGPTADQALADELFEVIDHLTGLLEELEKNPEAYSNAVVYGILDDIKDWIKGNLGLLKEHVKTAIDKLKDIHSVISDKAAKHLENIKDHLADLHGDLRVKAIEQIMEIKKNLGEIADQTKSAAIEKAKKALSDILVDLVSHNFSYYGYPSVNGGIINRIKDWIKGHVDALKGHWETAIDKLKDIHSVIGDKAAKHLENIKNHLGDLHGDLKEKAIQQILEIKENLSEIVDQTKQAAIEKAQKALGDIIGDLVKGAMYSDDLSYGILDDIRDWIIKMREKLNGHVKEAIDKLKDIHSVIGDKAAEHLENIKGHIGDLTGDAKVKAIEQILEIRENLAKIADETKAAAIEKAKKALSDVLVDLVTSRLTYSADPTADEVLVDDLWEMIEHLEGLITELEEGKAYGIVDDLLEKIKDIVKGHAEEHINKIKDVIMDKIKDQIGNILGYGLLDDLLKQLEPIKDKIVKDAMDIVRTKVVEKIKDIDAEAVIKKALENFVDSIQRGGKRLGYGLHDDLLEALQEAIKSKAKEAVKVILEMIKEALPGSGKTYDRTIDLREKSDFYSIRDLLESIKTNLLEPLIEDFQENVIDRVKEIDSELGGIAKAAVEKVVQKIDELLPKKN